MSESLVNILEVVDFFLEKLKGGEEDCVHCSRSAHGYAEPSIHVFSEEFNLGHRNRFALGVHQGVTLVNALDRIEGVWGRVLVQHRFGPRTMAEA